ncbi:glycoside hydrolase family 32 protein [Porphyrobacter algicida]|uniref:Glycoside hydrolase family 32 protein n=1 Tax=Qipengyuania algicida TaxID=1836209 RepID=A0A845ARF4_9SPHN|nr:glycoside hydrolase family 32 protein [Qipengyuania algicida]MXP29478.1 glycoside hydrolase family 32 protein [Qipengyuania algicida]
MTRLAAFVTGLLASAALGACAVTPPPATVPPSDPLRPLWHYTPPSGWMNDPNGMVKQGDTWQLFYQYYPQDTVWGPMHWGHATSTDLVRWTTRPVALAPGPEGYIFSGSAVIDRNDTAGFGKGALVAIYTIHDPVRAKAETRDHESQGLAYSLDGGMTFTKYAGNPVLPNPGGRQDFRDPSVFRDEARGQWVMALSVGDHAEFYASHDLKHWRFLSAFGAGVGAHGGVWECPNLFPIRDVQTGRDRWVLIQNLNPGGPQGGSGTQYFVGDWDGTRFTLDPEFAQRIAHDGPAWLDAGPDDYAGVTWNGAPDGRRVFMGWMSNWLYAQEVPTKRWRSAMTAPRDLTLSGIELRQTPSREIASLRGPRLPITLSGDGGRLPHGLLPSADIELTFATPPGSSFALELRNKEGERLVAGLDAQGWYIDRRNAGRSDFHDGFAAIHRAPRRRDTRVTKVRLLIDRTSIELFADDGATVMTEIFFPTSDFTEGSIVGRGGARLRDRAAWPLARNEDPIQ